MLKCDFEVISFSFKVEGTVCIKDEEFMTETQHIYWTYMLYKAYGSFIL